MTDGYPDAVYRNKLLQTTYYVTENKQSGNMIDANVEGDWLLHTYIVQLDYETFSEMPEGLNETAQAMWIQDRWSDLMPKIVDESRKHGWCVVQFYDTEPLWRVFNVSTFSDWIKETRADEDGDTYIERLGAIFQWADDLGNVGKDECYFNDVTEVEGEMFKNCFLVKFREGDGRLVFAYSDLPDALLDVVYNLRQIKGQMDFIGSKPGYKHLIYGNSATDENIATMTEQFKDVDVSVGIGAPKGVLEGIESVTDDNIKVVIPIFDKDIEVFAGITRLPVSYYMGERSAGGLGMEAEKTDLLKIDRKKNALFKRYEPTIKQIFMEHYGIDIDDLELSQDETIESVEEDGQEDKGSNSNQETD